MTEHELGTSLEAAEKNPELVSAAVAGLDEAALRYRPSPDKWSILEVLAHLADVEISHATQSGQSPNDLMDQRDKALDDLSSLANVSVTDQGNGMISVSSGIMAPPVAALLADSGPATPSIMPVPNFSGCRDSRRSSA